MRGNARFSLSPGIPLLAALASPFALRRGETGRLGVIDDADWIAVTLWRRWWSGVHCRSNYFCLLLLIR